MLDKGARNVEILKQGQYSPLTVEKQAAIIFCGTKGLLQDVPVKKIREFEAEFLLVMEKTYKDVLDALATGELDEKITKTLEKVAKDLSEKYRK